MTPSPTLKLSFVIVTTRFLVQPKPSGSLEPCAWGFRSLPCLGPGSLWGLLLPVPCQAGLFQPYGLHLLAHPMVVSLFQACPLPHGSCFPLTLHGWPGASSVRRRDLDGKLHLCSVFLLCWGHKLSPHPAVARWDSATRVTTLCTPSIRWEPACGPVTSVAYSLLQTCPAPGEAEKTTGLQVVVPSHLRAGEQAL